MGKTFGHFFGQPFGIPKIKWSKNAILQNAKLSTRYHAGVRKLKAPSVQLFIIFHRFQLLSLQLFLKKQQIEDFSKTFCDWYLRFRGPVSFFVRHPMIMMCG